VKLFYSPTSPYVRKVMACAIARGLEARIEKVPCNPHDSPPALLEANPLSKVPCLVTDDGFALFDSPVICEYLDSRGEALPLFPAQGAARWRALRQQAMADGILDAAVTGRGELGKPREAARDATIARFKAVIARTLDMLEAEPPHKLVDIGSIAVACALGYLDFRYAGEPWRGTRPRLAAWQEAFAQNPCIADTAPRE
jgi:glutathione S-transferase